MAHDDETMSELRARVYSRRGASDPRVERVDPVTGRTLAVTESEWALLQAQRAERARADMAAPSRAAGQTEGAAHVGEPGGPVGRRSAPGRAEADARAGADADAGSGADHQVPPARRRIELTRLGAGAVGAVAGGAIIALALGALPLPAGGPASEVAITPTPTPSAELPGLVPVPESAALGVFRDPERATGALRGRLGRAFPDARVAGLLPAEAPFPGASVYAVIPQESTACLVVVLEANGMIWNCSSMERVARAGLSLRAPVPTDLDSGVDGDGDGVAGSWSRTDLIEVEWRTDGTFVVRREPMP
jgi:hypothetical protein